MVVTFVVFLVAHSLSHLPKVWSGYDLPGSGLSRGREDPGVPWSWVSHLFISLLPIAEQTELGQWH